MTVDELIEELQKAENKNAIVKVLDEHSQYVPIQAVWIYGKEIELDG